MNYGDTTILDGLALNQSRFRNVTGGTVLIKPSPTNPAVDIEDVAAAGLPPSVFNNSGTLTVESTLELPTVMEVNFTNSGLTNVTDGQLLFRRHTVNSGVFRTNSVAPTDPDQPAVWTAITFSGEAGKRGLHTFLPGVTFEGKGDINAYLHATLRFPDGSLVVVPGQFTMEEGAELEGDGDGSGGQFAAGDFRWRGGSIQDGLTVIVNPSTKMQITDQDPANPAQRKLIGNGTTLLNLGGIEWDSASDILMDGGSLWQNNGATGPNFGGMNATASAGGIRARGNAGANDPTGRVEVLNNGSWHGVNPATAQNPNAKRGIEVPFINLGGTVGLTGYHFKKGYTQTAGLSTVGSGKAFVTGNLVVDGETLDLGTGTLIVDGDLQVADAGTLALALTPEGVGRASVTGTAKLGATTGPTLRLSPSATYTPAVGTRDTVVVAGTVTGKFATVTGGTASARWTGGRKSCSGRAAP